VSAAAYSSTPLAKKLGIVEGGTVFVIGAPRGYRALLAPLPPKVRFVKAAAGTDIVHVFAVDRAHAAAHLARLIAEIRPDAAVWVSWPKRSSKVLTTISEDVIREIALPLGFVDVKVCAIDNTWSGLKLVIRKTLRSR
jgi:hypothetical protein